MLKMAYGRKTRKVENPLRGVKEDPVKKAVDEYLTLRRIAHWRMNVGAAKMPSGQFTRFGSKGMADFYALKSGLSIWIECKRPVGGRLSADQKEFLDCVNRNGGIGIVVNSIESLEAQLKEAGVI